METSRCLKISGLPEDFDESLVTIIWENSDMTISKTAKSKQTLIIEFESEDAVENSMMFDGYPVTIEGVDYSINLSHCTKDDLSHLLPPNSNTQATEDILTRDELKRTLFVGNIPKDYDDSKHKQHLYISLGGNTGIIQRVLKASNFYLFVFDEESNAADQMIYDGLIVENCHVEIRAATQGDADKYSLEKLPITDSSWIIISNDEDETKKKIQKAEEEKKKLEEKLEQEKIQREKEEQIKKQRELEKFREDQERKKREAEEILNKQKDQERKRREEEEQMIKSIEQQKIKEEQQRKKREEEEKRMVEEEKKRLVELEKRRIEVEKIEREQKDQREDRDELEAERIQYGTDQGHSSIEQARENEEHARIEQQRVEREKIEKEKKVQQDKEREQRERAENERRENQETERIQKENKDRQERENQLKEEELVRERRKVQVDEKDTNKDDFDIRKKFEHLDSRINEKKADIFAEKDDQKEREDAHITSSSHQDKFKEVVDKVKNLLKIKEPRDAYHLAFVLLLAILFIRAAFIAL